MYVNCNKLYIFNICEHDISYRTASRIFNYLEANNLDDINESNIKNAIGNTPTSSKIVDIISNFDTSYLSLYALIIGNINILVIEKLKEYYCSIENLYDNCEEIGKYGFHQTTIQYIRNFCKNYFVKSPIINNIESIILKIVNAREETISFNDLFNKINEFVTVNTIDYYENLNKLSAENKISLLGNGVFKILPSIESYFSKCKEEKREVLLKKIQGKTYQELANYKNVSKQRIQQIVESEINKCPIFENELKIKKILSNYNISRETLRKIISDSDTMINYMFLKYTFNATKDEVDYVIDHQLETTELGKNILLNNRRVFIDDELIETEFISLFIAFLNKQNCSIFNVIDKKKEFDSFLINHGLQKNICSLELFSRKLDNNYNFANCGQGIYAYVNIEKFDEDFLFVSEKYLNNFYGYGFTTHFLEKNRELCRHSGIVDGNNLYAIWKLLYQEQYKNRIEFVRIPSIKTYGLTKEQFIEELIALNQPISIPDFKKILCLEYGYDLNYIQANVHLFGYLNNKNMLTVENHVLKDDVASFIKNIIETKKIVMISYLKKLLKKNNYCESDIIINSHTMKKINCRYTTTFVHDASFALINDSVSSYFKSLSSIKVTKDSINHLIDYDDMDNYRYNLLFTEYFLIRYTDDAYLNIEKMLDRNYIKEFVKYILNSLSSSKIYTFKEFKRLPIYFNCLEKFPEIKKIINSFGEQIFINILKATNQLTYIDTDYEFTFSKGVRVTVKNIVKSIINDTGSIELMELKYILDEIYGIDGSDICNGYILGLGCYYNTEIGKAYDKKSRCDEEIQQFLKGENKNELE